MSTTIDLGIRTTKTGVDSFMRDVRSQAVVVVPVSLAELKLNSASEINIPGVGNLPISKQGFEKLMSIVGVNKVTRNGLLSTGFTVDDVINLSNAMRSSVVRKMKAGVVIDTRIPMVTEFYGSAKSVVPNEMFMDSVFECTNRNKMEVIHAELTDTGSVSIMARPETIGFGSGGEEHKVGMHAKLTHGGGVINPYYERVVCSNGLTVPKPVKGISFSCTQPERVGAFLRSIRQFGGFGHDLFEQKMAIHKSVQASLYEVKTVHGHIVSLLPNQERYKELIESEIPLSTMDEIVSKKTMTGIKSMKDSVLRGLNSPMTSWDLINAATQIGTHVNSRVQAETQVDMYTRGAIIGLGGSLMFERSPDKYMPYEQIFN